MVHGVTRKRNIKRLKPIGNCLERIYISKASVNYGHTAIQIIGQSRDFQCIAVRGKTHFNVNILR